jgi:16S rRNA (cytosine1402-N4)-methyltransferase
MASESIGALELSEGAVVIDATLGGGGHASIIASIIGANGVLIGIDRDKDAIEESRRRFERDLPENTRPRIELIQARYDFGADEVRARGLGGVDGALFDLGVSSWQLDEPDRGFSFKDPDAPLDMRMDRDGSDPTASVLLNSLEEREIAKILWGYSDERWGARIAKFIVERRKVKAFESVGDLIDTIKAAVPASARAKDIHPATRTFQALRIAVNSEYEALESALRKIIDLLKPGGRIAVISYHSGEDRIVKSLFSLLSGKCICPPEQMICNCDAKKPKITTLTRKPALPTASEIAENPRARSAKLRAAQRI